MPPGPVYNWLAVAHSALVILDHALQYRAAQVTRGVLPSTHVSQSRQPGARGGAGAGAGVFEKARQQEVVVEVKDVVEEMVPSRATADDPLSSEPTLVQQSSLLRANEAWLRQLEIAVTPRTSWSEMVSEQQLRGDTTVASMLPEPSSSSTTVPETRPPPAAEEPPKPAADVNLSRSDAPPSQHLQIPESDAPVVDVLPPPRPESSSRHLQSSKVPSSRIGRLFHYGGLAASLGYGAASELLRRSTTSADSTDSPSSLMMTEANLTRLVSKLTRMRGAALKVGQFLSIQDTHVLPPELDRVFRRVQDSAHYMPNWQMESVMASSLGPSWRSSFANFNPIPFAAASIGQVHHAVLAPPRVAVKIQFPNIAESVASDLSYIRILLTAGRLLPRGLFLNKTLAVMKEELADECNYTREAVCMRSFGSLEKLGADARFKVPWVWEGSTDRVLVMEHMDGTGVGEDVIHRLPQEDRNEIAARVIDLCLRELFVFREMQTDPNWSNFLWNPKTRLVELVDFGATRSYSSAFIDNWLRLLLAAAQQDREGCLRWSLKLGYLTGGENDIMNNAHVESLQLLATPFREDTPQPFAFGPGSTWAGVTADIRERIPIMLDHRSHHHRGRRTPSTGAKLSGSFLLASRLRATVDCKRLWDDVIHILFYFQNAFLSFSGGVCSLCREKNGTFYH
ncbi:ABC1 family-domain-containing protein [Russula aff. rugulosa BPL654]|nr:ABC1 family-domain-containing protein [Russula aff. rugulosa BPL654]